MKDIKKGNTIKIRENLKVDRYGVNSVVDDMLQYKGKIATVMDVFDVTRLIKGNEIESKEYILDIDDGYYSWTLEMFNIDEEDNGEGVFYYLENILGIGKDEILQDYISNKSNTPTNDELIKYARSKFKDFL